MDERPFDLSRAKLEGPDLFPRFLPRETRDLSRVDASPSSDLIIVERNGERLGLLTRDLAHPHVAQGELGGLPYLVSF
ncbi:MAG: hypothetical protein AAGN82_26785 [Myxococcota bacterium]